MCGVCTGVVVAGGNVEVMALAACSSAMTVQACILVRCVEAIYDLSGVVGPALSYDTALICPMRAPVDTQLQADALAINRSVLWRSRCVATVCELRVAPFEEAASTKT